MPLVECILLQRRAPRLCRLLKHSASCSLKRPGSVAATAPRPLRLAGG